jgi:hypothetical protein
MRRGEERTGKYGEADAVRREKDHQNAVRREKDRRAL